MRMVLILDMLPPAPLRRGNCLAAPSSPSPARGGIKGGEVPATRSVPAATPTRLPPPSLKGEGNPASRLHHTLPLAGRAGVGVLPPAQCPQLTRDKPPPASTRVAQHSPAPRHHAPAS